jgi:hypothetical protein
VPDVLRSPTTRALAGAALLTLLSLSRGVAAATCGPENLLAGRLPSAATDLRGTPAQLTDGVVAQEGAEWNAPVVTTLGSPSAEVIYDLGEVREITALYMQGDANDVYKISGSVDGTAGSFARLGEFGNVINRGHGLRRRTVEIPPARVRYLRIGDASGDGFFSISELGAYCQKPSPFPPALKIVATAPQMGNGIPVERGWKAFGAIYGVAVFAAALLAWRARQAARAA